MNSRLRQQQLAPVKVKKKSRLSDIKFGSPKVNTKDLVTFTRLFATMIDAGLPLVQCLEILGSQQTNAAFGGILKDVRGAVEQALPLAKRSGVTPRCSTTCSPIWFTRARSAVFWTAS